MSHRPERKEKNCLNCGTTVIGRYCHVCGQENHPTSQSVWGFITHFVSDIFHFDGKFFSTLRQLLFRPGKIPREYVEGKRTRYLDPVKMYLFTSAFFFLIFFTLANPVKRGQFEDKVMTRNERLEYASGIHHKLRKNPNDSTLQNQFNVLLDTSYVIKLKKPVIGKPADSVNLIRIDTSSYLMMAAKRSRTIISSESSWMQTRLNKKMQEYTKNYGDDRNAMLKSVLDSFLHKLPYLLFVSLPFFAVILKLLYIRRKQFVYTDHAVFTLYHYIFTFILLLLYILIARLYEWLGWGILEVLGIVLFLSGGVYLFLSMKYFYRQKNGKTFWKFTILNFLGIFVLLFIFIAFIFLSIFQ